MMGYIEQNNKIPSHPEIQVLDRELKKLYQEKKLYGINLYLYGLILREQERLMEARQIFIESLNKFPYLWSCWIELCRIIES
jgi:anaphase-promoting complex subunit 8